MLSCSGLTEERVEGVVSSSDALFAAGHLSIRLDPMFQAVQLPAGVANLDTGLTNVDRDALTLWKEEKYYSTTSIYLFIKLKGKNRLQASDHMLWTGPGANA